MAAAPARALAADKRWGFAAAAPGRPPAAAGVLETAVKPANVPIQRGALPWGDRTVPPAPNAWGSSSLLSLKKGEGSGSIVNINDRPSSPGSSSMSTDESDLLDSPVAHGRTSHDSVSAISRPQSTELRSGSWKFPHSQNSFSDVLKAPLRAVAKQRPTSHRKGFTICADDFPLLDSKNSESNDQQGHCFQGRPSFSSVVIAARDEQRKIPLTGGDPVSTANFSWEPEQAQLHATQTPDICMPPPRIDYWHPPPDHPPDRNGPCKPADKTISFPIESFAHDGQSVLNQGVEERHGPHGVCHPKNNDSCYAHVPVDTFVKSLPHLILENAKDNHSDALEKYPVIKKDVAPLEKICCLSHNILGKVKGNHSDAFEKQPVIKKNVALLEKIKCLNIKARNLRACNMPEISFCKEPKAECPKSLNVKADHVANDVPFSAATSYITSAFDMANSVSERSNHVSVGTSNVSAILLTTDLSEGHVTEFSEAKKMGNSADNHVYGVADTSNNLCGSSVTDTASNIWAHGWKEHSTVYSSPVTATNYHEDEPFAGNCSQQLHARTANDMLKSRYEIQHSRWRESSTKYAEQLQMRNENIEHKTTFIAESEVLSTPPIVHSLKSNDAPGESADYRVYARSNASRNRHGSSAEDISFSMAGHGWNDHSTADSLPVVRTDTYQDQSFPEGTSLQVQGRAVDDMVNSPGYDIELSRRDLSAQHPKQLQDEERGKLKQKAKANAKLELKRCLFVQNQMSNDMAQETNKNLHKQNDGSIGTSNHTCCTVYAEDLYVPPRPNAMKNTAAAISFTQNVTCAAKKTDISMLEHIAQKSEAESHDSSAPKHLQTEDREGQVRQQESISRGPTPASDTADGNRSPLILDTIFPIKNTEIKIMEQIDRKGVSHSNESRTPMHFHMEEKRKHIHSHGRILRGRTPASGPAGVNKGSLIHNVIPSAKNDENSMMEHIAQRSASQSHENSSPKHLQMENRRRQVHPMDRVLRERSNIAESTEDITTVSGTHVHARNAEAKPHADLSTQSKNRPVSPCVFGTENTETSGLRKAPVSGVVINSSIITMQGALARGFTVGSIMLGDASVASVNQGKTVANEVDDDTTNSCASPKQTKQSGKNQHDEQHAKDPHGDCIMCTEVKEPSKKEQPKAGGVNRMGSKAIPAPNRPSVNQSTVLADAVPAKTSEMERHSFQPEYKELYLQNHRQMLQAEKHTTSSDNSSRSILETKSHHKETLHTSTATKSEVKIERENQEDEKKKISKHLVRSSAASDQGSTNASATLPSDLTEQEANSLVLKIMQELSDQLEQVEKQLDSTHVVAVSRSEPTQMVSLPGYTWGEHVGHSQREYHVDSQGNVWFSYAADMSCITQGVSALPTAHVLPGPVSVPENNTLDGSSAPVWTWDAAEGVLTSDMDNVSVVGTAITRSGNELTESMYGVNQMDLHSMQAIGGMSYEAVAANPEIIQYIGGLAHQQANLAWFPHSEHDVSYHSGSGTGVYWPQMDVGAAMQTHGLTGPVVGAENPGCQLQTHGLTGPVVGTENPDYKLMPVASPGAA